MSVTLKMKNMSGEYQARFSEYADNIPALLLFSARGERDVVTINLIDYGIRPRPGHIILKDYSEYAGIADALLEAGVVSEITFRHSFGFVERGGAECKVAEEYASLMP